MWVQKGRGKVGLSGNILVKSNIPKSQFDVFDITEDYGLNIQNMRKIFLVGFSIQRLWGKSLEISRNFSMGPLFSKYDWMGAYDYFILGSNIFFPSRYSSFGYNKMFKMVKSHWKHWQNA